ncbi:MAG: acyl carrier protein [Gammaproteobacteria bacterium]|nr:acyl carrier protein [Gammaproteobacteria bacterium]
MLEVRVKKILSQLFNVSENEINDETSSDTVSKWDSLTHMNLIVALEDEFKISFTDEQMIEMLNYPLILLTVKEALTAS